MTEADERGRGSGAASSNFGYVVTWGPAAMTADEAIARVRSAVDSHARVYVDDVAALLAAYDDMKARSDALVNGLLDELEELKARADELEKDRDHWKHSYYEIHKYYEAAKARAERMEAERNALKVERDEWEREARRIFDDRCIVEAERDALKAERDRNESALEDAGKEILNFNAKRLRAEAERDFLRAELDRIKDYNRRDTEQGSRCACRFDDDDNPIRECEHHKALRAENERLSARVVELKRSNWGCCE